MGKTHLAINLALELVRRGHLAGVFHDAGPMSSVDEVLGLPQAAPLLRRAEDDDEIGVIVLTTITVTCIFFEIIGPILTKFALKKAGESPQERLNG